jgi:hypothetical protein
MRGHNSSKRCFHCHPAPPRTTAPGELTDIERVNNRTEVIVDEGINTVSYALDEQLIEALTLIQFGGSQGLLACSVGAREGAGTPP